MFIDTRSEFIFKDPDALDALLHYDWRTREVLTDLEVVGSASRPGAVRGADGTASVLRHMQRLRCITAVHGVRRQGGRMRLWRMEEVLKLQAALDLKAETGLRLSACAEVFSGPHAGEIAAIVKDWKRHVGAPARPETRGLKRFKKDLLEDRTALLEAVARSVEDFVTRNRFEDAAQPAFLL